jgi:hydrogenase maturation factor HypF (carbamoyltransferase family)
VSSAHQHHHAHLSKIPATNSTNDATTSVVTHFFLGGGVGTYKKTKKQEKKGNTNNWKN